MNEEDLRKNEESADDDSDRRQIGEELSEKRLFLFLFLPIFIF